MRTSPDGMAELASAQTRTHKFCAATVLNDYVYPICNVTASGPVRPVYRVLVPGAAPLAMRSSTPPGSRPVAGA
jgi:hypothetical protein